MGFSVCMDYALTNGVPCKQRLARAKALILCASVAARLKSCPFTKPGTESDW